MIVIADRRSAASTASKLNFVQPVMLPMMGLLKGAKNGLIFALQALVFKIQAFEAFEALFYLFLNGISPYFMQFY